MCSGALHAYSINEWNWSTFEELFLLNNDMSRELLQSSLTTPWFKYVQKINTILGVRSLAIPLRNLMGIPLHTPVYLDSK